MATEVEALPDDALAAVFRALPPRSLAVVRCVCKAWRAVVDARALLLSHLHLLPLTVRGVFLNYRDNHPHHLVRPRSPSPTTIPRVDGSLSFLPNDRRRCVSVRDHCNGLLLCETKWVTELCVCNPATRRWTVLPRGADDGERPAYAGAYVAFDPAESPHYQVILVPEVPPAPAPPYRCRPTAAEVQQQRALLREKEKDTPFCLDWFFSLPEDGTAVGQWEKHDFKDPCLYMEWPPAPWKLRVFSSSTGQWEDRVFVREEGMPAGSVEKAPDLEFPYWHWRYAVYHHGSLYAHCRRGSFVIRLSLSESKYQIIETPTDVNELRKPYLGKLQNRICFGIVHDHQLKIWILNESCGQMEWHLKYEISVGHYAKYLESIAYDSSGREHDGSWTIERHIEIQDTNHDVDSQSEEESIGSQDTDHDVESLSEEENVGSHDTDNDVEYLSEEENIESQDSDHDVESLLEEGYEWDSDNDDVFTIKTEINSESQKYFNFNYDKHFNIIGFHPYKEVVFMVREFQVVAYHLNSTKIQYLGNSHPKCCQHSFWNRIHGSFLYTPCMIGDLLHGDQTGGLSSSED